MLSRQGLLQTSSSIVQHSSRCTSAVHLWTPLFTAQRFLRTMPCCVLNGRIWLSHPSHCTGISSQHTSLCTINVTVPMHDRNNYNVLVTDITILTSWQRGLWPTSLNRISISSRLHLSPPVWFSLFGTHAPHTQQYASNVITNSYTIWEILLLSTLTAQHPVSSSYAV